MIYEEDLKKMGYLEIKEKDLPFKDPQAEYVKRFNKKIELMNLIRAYQKLSELGNRPIYCLDLSRAMIMLLEYVVDECDMEEAVKEIEEREKKKE